MNVLRILFFLISVNLLLLPAVAAGPLQIALLSETTVSGDSIFLSHLLPPHVSLELQNRATKLFLARAPALGSIRMLDCGYLTAALRTGDFPAGQFRIPETVTVHRANSGITKEDVMRAINERMTSAGGAAYLSFPNDLQVDPPRVSTTSAAALEITEIAHDSALNCTRFRLRLLANPSVPPFYAWVSTYKRAAAQSSNPLDLMVSAAGAPAAPHGAPRIALVDPRRLASLHLHSANMSTVLLVRPLQTGQSGDTIRVRIPSTGKTLFAKVVGTDTLEAVL